MGPKTYFLTRKSNALLNFNRLQNENQSVLGIMRAKKKIQILSQFKNVKTVVNQPQGDISKYNGVCRLILIGQYIKQNGGDVSPLIDFLLAKSGITPAVKHEITKNLSAENYLTPRLTLSGFHPTIRFNAIDNLISNIDFCSSINEAIDPKHQLFTLNLYISKIVAKSVYHLMVERSEFGK